MDVCPGDARIHLMRARVQVLARVAALVEMGEESAAGAEGRQSEVERLVQHDLTQMEQDWLQFRKLLIRSQGLMVLQAIWCESLQFSSLVF
jgi:hypothetical protein